MNTVRALQHRNYQLFFAGQLVSLIGTWMQTAAQTWLVYRLGGSAQMLGLAGFFSQGPVFLLAQVGGAVADHYNRHHILVVTQTLSLVLALVLALLTLSGRVEIWQVFLVSALLGVVNAFDIPCRQSFLVEMVGREDLQNAIALNASMFNGARLVGPAVAGVLVATVGEGWCFLLNALSFIAVIIGLLAMRLPPFIPHPPKAAMLEQVRLGLVFAVTTPPIRLLLLLVGGISLLGVPYTVLLPIVAHKVLGGGAGHYGLLMSATGFGAVTGALVLASRSGLKGTGRIIGISAMLFGVFLMVFSRSHLFLLSLGLLTLVGFFQMTMMASTNTLVQSMVPDEYRGRVMALYSMMFLGMVPFGGVIAGLVAGRVGAENTILLCGA